MEEAGLAAALTAAAGRGFDLSGELPLRAHLFQIEAGGAGGSATDRSETPEQQHVLLLLLHHIAGDGWSLGPLGRDLSAFYRARREGGAATLAGAARAVRRLHAVAAGGAGGRERCFERAVAAAFVLEERACRLAGPDRAAGRPAAAGGVEPSRRQVGFDISAELHRGLSALARGTGASLFMVLQAGLAALLSRLGAGTDIAIGSPIAGRTDAALDDLVGFFVNTLVLRTDTSGQPSFRELVGRVRASNLAAYAHQELPFERLVEVLNPARSLSRHPLFQVMLAFETQAAPAARSSCRGLRSRRSRSPPRAPSSTCRWV